MVLIIVLNDIVNDAYYETERNIIKQSNIVSLSVPSVFIGGKKS